MVFWLCVLVLVSALLLGGGSHAGFLGDVVVQLIAVPLLVVAIRDWVVRMADQDARHSTDLLLSISLVGLAVLLLLQLTPWGPASGGQIQSLTGAGAWRGLSATPSASGAAAVSLIPFLALYFGVSQLDAGARLKLAAVVTIMGVAALLVGFAQVLDGPSSSLRFFDVTNPSEAVGFFANRNHFAAQLYTTLVFAAAWLAFSTERIVKSGRLDTHALLWFIISAIVIIGTLAGLMMARSRAGLALSVAALAGIAAILFVHHFGGERAKAVNRHSIRRLAVVVFAIAVIFAAQFGVHRIMTRFDADPLKDLRFALSPATLELAYQNTPFGTGLGSFVDVYANNENRRDLLGPYANRAHNDWAEFLLETGLIGAIIGISFLAWFSVRAYQVWRQRAAAHMESHLILQRGATLVIVLLLTHSLVDYPLRTTGMAAIFAFAGALLVHPPKASPMSTWNRFQTNHNLE